MIQSVDRAIRILKALAGGPGRLGVSELSERLGLAKGTVHGLLRTLHEHGLVEQHAESDKYQLGPQLLQLSNRYLDLSDLRARSLVWSEALAGRTDEAVRVGVVYGSVMASFNVEGFGPERVAKLTDSDIAARFAEFKRMTHFEPISTGALVA
jgi:DNA-binding IclR family transcriptional regulator